MADIGHFCMELEGEFGGGGSETVDRDGYMGYRVSEMVVPYMVVLWKDFDYCIIKILRVN